MTNFYRNTNNRWDAALLEYAAAEAAAAAVAEHPSSPARDHIIGLLYDTADAIFALAAPTLDGVVQKLKIYWREDVWEDDTYGNHFKRMIVGDLRRIERQLAGVTEPDASGGMDEEKIASDWANAIADHDRWTHVLAEGPSKRWGSGTRADITALVDNTEAAILSLPAPNLDAVIRKLTAIWKDDRFGDRVCDAVDHLLILRDLRRFAFQQQ